MSDNFDPFDPVNAAMRNLNNANLLQAKDARIRQLEERLGEFRYAGNELARVLSDIDESGEVRCAIAKAVIKSTLAKWNAAKQPPTDPTK